MCRRRSSARIAAAGAALSIGLALVPSVVAHADTGNDPAPVESVPTENLPPPETTLPTTVAIEAPPTTTTTPARRIRLPRRPETVNIGSVVVELSTQRAFVYTRSRRLVAVIPVSTGKRNTTPVGSFRVFSKSAQAFYSVDPRERMRWMVRFTKGRDGDNIGFHGIPYRVTASGEVPLRTPIGKKPSSHGCIRMRVHDAKWLFDNIDETTPVRVVRTYRR